MNELPTATHAQSQVGLSTVYLASKEGSCATGLDRDAIVAALESRVGVLWVDLAMAADECLDLLRDVFHFHPLAVEDASNTRIDSPKIDDYGDYLFIVSQSVDYLNKAERLQIIEVDIFLGSNYVVTVRHQPVPAIDDLMQRARQNPHVLARGADFLAHTVLDSLVDLMLPAVEQMDEMLDDLEHRVLDHPSKELLPQVLLLKRNALRLRRSILPQRDLVNRLSRGEYALIGSEALIFYRDVYDHVVRVDEMLEGLRDLADSALGSYLSSVNNRMNEIMKALSVVSVVFLPLTLIASIFGTNLDYSSFGLQAAHGFYLMLAVMLALALAMLAYFRRRGWF